MIIERCSEMILKISFQCPTNASNALTLVIGSFVLLAIIGCNRSHSVIPFDAERIEMAAVVDGEKYFVVDDGNAYREVDPGKSWEHYATLFDPQEVKRSYIVEEDITYRLAPDTHKRFAVQRELSDSFDDLNTGLPGLVELIGENRLKWGSFTLQSPEAQTVEAYVSLRKELIAGKSGFRDCFVQPTTEKSHSGNVSLKCMSPAKPDSMICCKASISSPLPYFRNGDDFWYEAYYWVEGSLPLTLVDLECDFVVNQPGIRLRIFEDGALGIELKALEKPQYRQAAASLVRFPKGRWVCARIHLELSTGVGKMEIWQDGQKVLDTLGVTLPFRSAIYNSLEVCISAHCNSAEQSVLYVDDLRISASEFPD